jgi:hypothetical protein
MAERSEDLSDPAGAVFREELDAAISAMLDGLLARGYRIERFAFAFDAELPDRSRAWGARSTGYTGEEGYEALAYAAVAVREASDAAGGPALWERADA